MYIHNQQPWRNAPPSSRDWQIRTGFTLVELLVVIAIIGVLVSLLLPAVQSAREAVRMVLCQNNMKQISLGSLQHLATHGHFPSGGWSFQWTGDADRGFTEEQPGSWVYNVLPFVEQQALYLLPADGDRATITTAQKTGALKMDKTPLPSFNCPSRRRTMPYPNNYPTAYTLINVDRSSPVAKTDYAANGGTLTPCPCQMATSLAQADAPFTWQPQTRGHTGVISQRSTTRLASVRDGASNTIVFGEKYLSPDHYTSGTSPADDHSMYMGYDQDTIRWAYGAAGQSLARDRAGYSTDGFGSAHPSGAVFANCDGSIHVISFNADYQAFANLCHRNDGKVVDVAGL